MNKPSSNLGVNRRLLAAAVVGACLGGCANTQQSTGPASSGSAGGASAVGSDATLQTCAAPTGTVRLQDDQLPNASGPMERSDNATVDSVRLLLRDLNGYQQPKNAPPDAGVTLDALRLLIQQSNCLVIVDRGVSELDADDEKRRSRGPNTETRAGSGMGRGQEVAADFVLRARVLSVNSGESKSRFNVGSFIPFKALGGLSGGESVSSADVQIVLSDVRSKVQLAVAQGHGTATDTHMAAGLLSRVGSGFGAGRFETGSKTAPSKILLEAYADAYNKLVPAMRNYKAQTVKGGLGTGGTMKVQGSP